MLAGQRPASYARGSALMNTGFVIPQAPQAGASLLRPYVEPLRQVRGFNMSTSAQRTVRLESLSDGTTLYHVPSENQPGVMYTVEISPVKIATCSGCPDFKKNGNDACKHIIEVLYRYFGETIIPHPSQEILKLTMGQTNYYEGARRERHVPVAFKSGLAESTRLDKANEGEDARVRSLSTSIAKIIDHRYPVHDKVDDNGRKVGGRPTLPYGQRVHYEIVRDQERKSARKFKASAAELTQDGELDFAPCRNSVSKYASDKDMKSIRSSVFRMTTNPFLHLEEDIIIDSTGYSSFQISCWLDSNRGSGPAQRSGTKWFKLHIAIGRISKAILGFVITENTGSQSADTVQFEPLLQGLEEAGFKMRYVVADNIYLTQKAIATTKQYGAMLVGPLKPRNYDKKGKINSAIASIGEFKIAYPKIYDDLCKARQPIEGVFSVFKRRSNKASNIGTADEREALAKGQGPVVFVSREAEFVTRIIRYNLAVINRQEHYRGQTMSLGLSAPTYFGPIHDATVPLSTLDRTTTMVGVS